jgi:hypothetical protein
MVGVSNSAESLEVEYGCGWEWRLKGEQPEGQGLWEE